MQPIHEVIFLLLNGKLPSDDLMIQCGWNSNPLPVEMVITIARGNHPSPEDVRSLLYEMCDSEHASCNDNCLVFKLNGSAVPLVHKGTMQENCRCFKDGRKMEAFILLNADQE